MSHAGNTVSSFKNTFINRHHFDSGVIVLIADNQFLKLVLEVLQWNITFAYCGYDVDPDSDSGYQTTL